MDLFSSVLILDCHCHLKNFFVVQMHWFSCLQIYIGYNYVCHIIGIIKKLKTLKNVWNLKKKKCCELGFKYLISDIWNKERDTCLCMNTYMFYFFLFQGEEITGWFWRLWEGLNRCTESPKETQATWCWADQSWASHTGIVQYTRLNFFWLLRVWKEIVLLGLPKKFQSKLVCLDMMSNI